MKWILYSLVCFSPFVVGLGALNAQELQVQVRIMHEKIQGVDREVFSGMERSIQEFLSNRRWTEDSWDPAEKIECNILLNLTKVTDGDVYEGTMNISASRPVYNSNYSSPIVQFVDRNLRFRYSPFIPIQFDENRVSGTDAMASNLPAMLAFYSFLIIGLDYESFSPEGGLPYFKKAQYIVQNAPEQGSSIPGWKPTEPDGRYWLIDQLLSPRFKPLRDYWYVYHREGLDQMFMDPMESGKAILEGLVKVRQMHQDNPGSILLQFFFNAKSQEIMSILAQQPRETRGIYVTMLQQMDVPNAQKYQALK